jgi:RNA polymerase sigma-70 factor (ECF subfamily)
MIQPALVSGENENCKLATVDKDKLPTGDSPQAPTDWELLEKARSGDDKAFGMLVTRHKNRVAATVIGMLGDRPEADDVGQEVFVRFYRSMADFRGEANLSTYLTRIAINLSLNELKRNSRWTKLFSSTDNDILQELPDELGDEHLDDRRRINRALTELSADHRTVIVLRLIDGYSTAETAEILNLPVGTVLSRLARAQAKMKDLLLPIYGEKG